MKYSFIIPVYNVEEYISKCLDSVLSQTYSNYEVIVVNDGTPDNSQSIIDQYVKKDNRIKSVIKENGGLSSARNYGLNYVTGDYIIFLDSDDYIEEDLLSEINKEATKNKPDLIKFQSQMVDESKKIIKTSPIDEFQNCDNNIACQKLAKDGWMVIAWIYAYKKDFWMQHNFKYPVGKIHEDVGLTPYILMCANRISSIPYIGHNYVHRMGSIMNNRSMDKKYQYALDILFHYNVITKQIDESSLNCATKKIMHSYMANIVINKCNTLDNRYLNKYIHLIKENNVIQNLADTTIPQKLKKRLLKMFPRLYVKTILKIQCKDRLL